MQPTDWGQAWQIVGGGLLTTFLIMSLLAVLTHFMGKIFVAVEKRQKADQAGGEAKS